MYAIHSLRTGFMNRSQALAIRLHYGITLLSFCTLLLHFYIFMIMPNYFDYVLL